MAAIAAFGASAVMANDEQYRDDGTQIRYYLDNADAKNLLVVFQGSDCNSVRHMESVRKIWDAFAPDAALLTIEKYGIDDSLSYVASERDDCPADFIQHDTMGQRISDGVRVIETLKYSYGNVTLAGGSEGGSIALGVAAQIPEVKAVLALNSGSSSFQHDVEFSIQQTVPANRVDEVLSDFRQFVAQIRSSNAPFPIQVSGHGYAFWKDALARDLLKPLKIIDAPVLVIQSAEDKSVDPKRTQQEVEQIIAEGASNVTLKMAPGLDHGFRDAAGKSQLKALIESTRFKH